MCTNTIGSFECSCNNGYEFVPEDSIADLTNAGRACIGMNAVTELLGSDIYLSCIGLDFKIWP